MAGGRLINAYGIIYMLSGQKIRNCRFAYKCTKKWSDLRQTQRYIDNVRFCDECEQEVHLCITDAQLSKAIRENKCIAIRESRPYKALSNKRQAPREPATTVGVPSSSSK